MIKLENVSKSYGEQRVLKDFSADFPEGATVLMGPSGRGKTTLLRLMMGLEAPDSGAIAGVPERMAAVFQEDRLPMDFRAAACVGMAAERGTGREEIVSALRELGLGDELGKPVESSPAVSGGACA